MTDLLLKSGIGCGAVGLIVWETISNPQTLWAIMAWWVFSAFVSSLDLQPSDPRWYHVLYRFLHILAANIKNWHSNKQEQSDQPEHGGRSGRLLG